ncbi:PspC domain-containing protein [Streptomyces sp. MMG1121]|uniref:PspC domain-containing protein n=1 Tax=Streptomyces sp. MMG1121 TaxID=1415544 RepID=UPI0006AE9740|nr:PspC domain-containing protein [Streptomyces sp. MMG1121]KOV67176.1 membrane protein [Streptomyces sp. MMG1121]
MTDHEHAATGPGPGTGPRPAPGTGPTDAGPAATHRTGAAGAGTDIPAGEQEQAPAPFDRFRRDRRNRMIGGVCAGLGRQTDMDPVIFRITLAVLAATGGIGLIFYGFVWLLVPYEDEEENELRKLLTARVDGQALAAVLFALVGCGIFLTMLRNGGVLTFAAVLSLLLAGAGYWSRRRDAADPDPLSAQAAADAPPEAQAPPVITTYPSWWRDPIVKDGTHDGGTGYLWGPGDARERDLVSVVDVGVAIPWPHTSSAGPVEPRSAATPPRPRGPRWIGGWVFLLALVAGGLGTGLTWDTHPLGTSLQTGLACALAVFGLGLAISAFLGRTGAGTVFLALITAALLAGASAMPKDITSHWRDTSWAPAATAQVQPRYELGTGRGTLDLTRVHPAKGQTVSTDAHVGAGQLKVVLPAAGTVRLTIDVGVGDIRLPGESRKDVDVQPRRHKAVTLAPAKGAKDAGTLDITLGVGAGQVEVSRAAS